MRLLCLLIDLRKVINKYIKFSAAPMIKLAPPRGKSALGTASSLQTAVAGAPGPEA
jgi:hypothetical protein